MPRRRRDVSIPDELVDELLKDYRGDCSDFCVNLGSGKQKSMVSA